MLTFKDKKLFFDNVEILINSAEIHYFRVPKSRWKETIVQAKNAHMNTISSYIPWFIHENKKDQFDFTGIENEQNNLREFIKLCQDEGMYFFGRPGPYIMAEFINEGLPDYIFEIKEITPFTWNQEKPVPPVINYLNVEFLNRTKNWFTNLEEQVFSNFTNVISIQLCNEIGMLHWVSNSPDLTKQSRGLFAKWLLENTGEESINRYQQSLERIEKISNNKILLFHNDFHRFSRWRYKVYVDKLASFWEEIAPNKYLYMVNIHGCGGNRSLTYPIGISQLIDTYKDKSNIISGSDIYLSEFNVGTIQDSYLANAYTAASNGIQQPLTSLEFNAGDANYANSLSARTANSDIGMRIDLFYLQENKMINFYTFAGGNNYRTKKDYQNGFNRISLTGEKHGFACPISPDGEKRLPYFIIEEKMRFYENFNHLICQMRETTSNVKLAFVNEYYMTEYCHPKSSLNEKYRQNLANARDDSFFSDIGRALLLNGYSFKALDVNNEKLTNDLLITPTAKYMSETLQTKYVNHLKNGGEIIFYGEVPQKNLFGETCTILKDYLNIDIIKTIASDHLKHTQVSLKPLNYDAVESFTHFAQLIDAKDANKLFEVYGEEKGAGVYTENYAFITGKYRCDLKFMENLLTHFQVRKNYYTDYSKEINGIFTSSLIKDEQEFIYLFNLDEIAKDFYLFKENTKVYNSKLHLESRETLIIPKNIQTIHGNVIFATAKIEEVKNNGLKFVTKAKFFEINLETTKEIKNNEDVVITKVENYFHIKVKMTNYDGEFLLELN